MKTGKTLIVSLIWLASGVLSGVAVADFDAVTLEGYSEYAEVRPGDGRDVHIGVFIRGEDVRKSVRAPIAVTLAIDISGSMHGEKIVNARLAALRFLEALGDADQLSLVVFNESASLLAPMAKLSPARREALRRTIRSLRPSGGTNLYGGLGTAIDQAASADAGVRRVILISDGQGNVGPSDAGSLGRLASDGNERHVQVSAIGVGVDYDETALSAIAIRSAGRYSHLRDPSMLASLVEAELSRLSETVATEIVIEIRPRPGVILEAITPGILREGQRYRIPIGALHGGQQRELLLRARLGDNIQREKDVGRIAELRLEGKGAEGLRLTKRTEIRADIRSNPRAERDPRIVALIEEHRVAEAELRAAEAFSKGAIEEARRALDEGAAAARSALAAAPSGAARSRLSRKTEEISRRAERAGRPAAYDEVRDLELESRDSALESYGY